MGEGVKEAAGGICTGALEYSRRCRCVLVSRIEANRAFLAMLDTYRDAVVEKVLAPEIDLNSYAQGGPAMPTPVKLPNQVDGNGAVEAESNVDNSNRDVVRGRVSGPSPAAPADDRSAAGPTSGAPDGAAPEVVEFGDLQDDWERELDSKLQQFPARQR